MNWNKLDEFVTENVLPVLNGMALVTVTLTLLLIAGRH